MSAFPDSGGGTFLPFLGWKSKEQEWELVLSEKKGDTWEKRRVRFKPDQLRLELVLSTCRVGWAIIDAGKPDYYTASLIGILNGTEKKRDQPPDKGRESYKKAFQVEGFLYGKESLAVQFSGIGAIVYNSVSDLVALCLKSPEYKEGKNPIVTQTGTKLIKTAKGSAYAPEFAVKEWADAKPQATQEAAEDEEDGDLPF